MRIELTWFESLEEQEVEYLLSSNTTLVTGKCVVPCPNNYLITHCICLALIDGFLLRMTSILFTIALYSQAA
jgi:hypothetical protein